MINFVTVQAIDWRGQPVACQFKALADGNAVSANNAAAPVFRLPDPTKEVKVTATPTAVAPQVPVHWEQTVTLSVASTGAISAKAGSGAFVKFAPPIPAGPTGQIVNAIVKLSRFKDATSDVVNLLKHLPTKRTIQGVDTPVNATDEIQTHKDIYGTWPPANWNLNNEPNAHFLDAKTPTKSGVLNFIKGALPTIDVDSVVLRLAGTDVPQLFAVAWPRKMAPTATSSPTPFFLFIRQSNKGNHYDEIGLFVGGDLAAYPDNFDYADEGLFANLHYGSDPLKNPGSKGVPYQAAMAGRKVVTVAPCNKFADEFGVLAKTEQTGKLLEEIQAFMFWRAGIPDPPNVVGDTAIGSFSSGTFHLDNWLRDAANASDKFLNDVVKAVYWLDPRTDFVDRFIQASLDWAKRAGPDKRIRLYMRYPSASHNKLLGKSPPSSPYILNTTGDLRTAAVMTDANWAKVVTKYLGGPAFDKVAWQWAHHVICATMLTHALTWDFSAL